jgi:glycosyltransferase involved in cell wall biosynthesis
MPENVSVAVVVPVYNRRLKLINTLATVVAQRKAPALLVVIDDGSSDAVVMQRKAGLQRTHHLIGK